MENIMFTEKKESKWYGGFLLSDLSFFKEA